SNFTDYEKQILTKPGFSALSPEKYVKEAVAKRTLQQPLFHHRRSLAHSNLTTIVGHAVLADAVRQADSTALGAGVDTGSLQLPHGAATLVSALLGYFTLRDGHFDTSLSVNVRRHNITNHPS